MVRLQFSLWSLLALTTAACVVATAAHQFGLIVVIGALQLALRGLSLLLAWAVFYHLAPSATKYATVFLLIGTGAMGLMICKISHSRELARRNLCMHNLKALYLEQGQTKQPAWPLALLAEPKATESK